MKVRDPQDGRYVVISKVRDKNLLRVALPNGTIRHYALSGLLDLDSVPYDADDEAWCDRTGTQFFLGPGVKRALSQTFRPMLDTLNETWQRVSPLNQPKLARWVRLQETYWNERTHKETRALSLYLEKAQRRSLGPEPASTLTWDQTCFDLDQEGDYDSWAWSKTRRWKQAKQAYLSLRSLTRRAPCVHGTYVFWHVSVSERDQFRRAQVGTAVPFPDFSFLSSLPSTQGDNLLVKVVVRPEQVPGLFLDGSESSRVTTLRRHRFVLMLHPCHYFVKKIETVDRENFFAGDLLRYMEARNTEGVQRMRLARQNRYANDVKVITCLAVPASRCSATAKGVSLGCPVMG